MNESNKFNAFAANSFCRVCLKTTNDLTAMSNEHVHLYRSIVEEVAIVEYDMKTCKVCLWMLQRFHKFKHQCQSANNLLKEVVYMDSKSLIFLQNLTSGHHMTLSRIETNYYGPSTLASDKLHYDSFENCTNNYDSKLLNDTNNYHDMIPNDTNDYHIKVNDANDNRLVSEIDISDRSQRLVCSSLNNHSILDTANSNTYKYDKVDNDTIDDTYDNDTHENDIVIDNEDELPLVLLRKSVGKEKKKSKKKKKIKKEMHTDIVPITEELFLKEDKASDAEVKRRPKKELRDGFTSRMVQETDEYIVIKLTRDQVLEEMAERAKTDAYSRSPFKCERCVKAFNFEDVLQTHLEKHSMKNGTFECDMCGQYCPSAVSLRGHIKSHTTRYKCKLCGHIRLSRQHLLEHHAITHTSAATAYNCDYCQFTTNKRTVMQRHVRRHAAGEPHACHKCGKLFKSIESLRLHTVRHDRSSRFKCDRCDKTFVYHSLLRRHVQCVHERREFYCVECDVQFKCAESLRLHFKKAKRHRDFSAYKHVCPECGARFFSPPSLAAHLSAAHDAPKTHACPHCRRLYSSRDAVRAHAWRAHTRREARVTCPHCGTSFARKSTLKLHILTHTGARPHTCECGAAFTQSKTLQAHMQAKHKKEEMRQCENKIEV